MPSSLFSPTFFLRAHSPSLHIEVPCQLGAVYGLQADLCKDVGDLGSAAGLYRKSAAVLQPHALRDSEVRGAGGAGGSCAGR